MREGAADWLSTLSPEKTASWDELIKEFKATYFKSAELKWAQARDLFQEPMKDNERVDDFVIRIRRAAKRVNLGEEMLHYAILNGLKPIIRNQVLAKGVQSLEETLRTARIAECSAQTDPVQSLLMETLKSNKEVADRQSLAISALANKIQTLLEPLETTDVRIMDRDNARGASENTPRARNNDRPTQFTPNSQGRRWLKPTPQRIQRQNYGRQQQQIAQRGAPPTRSEEGYRNQNPNAQTTINCGNCARTHTRGQCPAFRQVCRACGRIGHFSFCCRSGRRA